MSAGAPAALVRPLALSAVAPTCSSARDDTLDYAVDAPLVAVLTGRTWTLLAYMMAVRLE